jgi:hypothetical protein
MDKLLSRKELYSSNIIGAKITNEKREYASSVSDEMIVKTIRRTSYLKRCWMCGIPFESKRINTIACCSRCSQNVWHTRQLGLNPPANMQELLKPKNTKDIREQFGYM